MEPPLDMHYLALEEDGTLTQGDLLEWSSNAMEYVHAYLGTADSTHILGHGISDTSEAFGGHGASNAFDRFHGSSSEMCSRLQWGLYRLASKIGDGVTLMSTQDQDTAQQLRDVPCAPDWLPHTPETLRNLPDHPVHDFDNFDGCPEPEENQPR